MTIGEILFETTQKLEAAGIDTARLDAEVLLAHCLGCDRVAFLKSPERTLPDRVISEYRRLLDRRLRFEPVAYLTGRKDFWRFTLAVGPDVLIPRPDTEVIVEEALALCLKAGLTAPRIADIGTGSGAIAIALAAEIPDAEVTATDLSPGALRLARQNAEKYQLETKIRFVQGDLFEPLSGLFDLIVSNPPYIAEAEYESLPPGVKDFEPKTALWAGQTGLEFYEKLVYQAQSRLKSGGWLLLEIGATQADAVEAMLAGRGYQHIAIRADYAGRPRVAKGRRL